MANKRISDLTDYTTILPYASEMFGVYQPMIGWKSKRVLQRMNQGVSNELYSKYKDILNKYEGIVNFDVTPKEYGSWGMVMAVPKEPLAAIEDEFVQVGIPRRIIAKSQNDGMLLSTIANILNEKAVIPKNEEWLDIINEDFLKKLLNTQILEIYRNHYRDQVKLADESHGVKLDARELENRIIEMLKAESAMAGALLGYAKNKLFDKLSLLFFTPEGDGGNDLESIFETMKSDFKDPFLTFDPKQNIINDVSLSPIGIVHLYRQFFFELDTFLGTPVSHVWLSPGSSVELIETSSRKSITEKTFETSLESISKTESSSTEQDEISKAVKEDNKDDMKLGFTSTVNQSWGTGNASATGSLNMDKTQQVAREQSNKKMRQQTEKLSSEIRQNFKSTFKTITEVTDTTSKRYVLNNTTQDLINYELRRKMRQVGVQIQDIGSYLCWETFVDEPGKQLGLPNLVHIAQPADLILVPNPKHMPEPNEFITIGFTGEMVWNFPDDDPQQHAEDYPEVLGKFVPLNTIEITGVPNDYEVNIPIDSKSNPNPFIQISKNVIAAKDDNSWGANNWGALGMITPDKKRIIVGITTAPKPDGLGWDDRITFKISGTLTCKLNATKRKEIKDANDALDSAKLAADNENKRKTEESYRKTAQERITLASNIKKRKFEDLREEERTIVYRNLIRSLMTKDKYENLPDTASGFQSRHVLSELINAIFDIDKMLYFVAPEWWKPRQQLSLSLGSSTIQDTINDSLVKWPDQPLNSKGERPGPYFITDKSEPAPLGSSLGWLLQLDGDDLRNAFLNAPWVKAVIPIRPGKEQAAINWLQNVTVEGADGLDADYAASEKELSDIRAALLLNDPEDPVRYHPNVTINDAIRKLCLDVAKKEEASKIVGKYPKEETDDTNKVLATPIEKVYEHGFYPLKGGFKAKVEDNFEIISQWIEVLPTDQVVPVEVKYNPISGRQIRANDP